MSGWPCCKSGSVAGELKTLRIENNYLAAASVDAQDINDNGEVEIAGVRTDTGWSIASNAMTYTGSPDRVRIQANIHQRIADNANIQRAAPQLQLQRNGTTIATSSTGYIRDFSDHEDSSNSISFVDPSPGTDPVYTLLSVQETTNGGVVTTVLGSFSAEAVEITECEVYATTNDGDDGGDDGVVTILADCGNIGPTFFNEQQFSWGFQMISGNAVSQWQYVISGANYQLDPTQINNSNEFTYNEIANADGTFDHVFTSVAGLAANASSGTYQINGVDFGFNPTSASQSWGCT